MRDISHTNNLFFGSVVFLSQQHSTLECRWAMANSLVSDWLRSKRGLARDCFGGLPRKIRGSSLGSFLQHQQTLPAKTQRASSYRSQRHKGKAQKSAFVTFCWHETACDCSAFDIDLKANIKIPQGEREHVLDGFVFTVTDDTFFFFFFFFFWQEMWWTIKYQNRTFSDCHLL